MGMKLLYIQAADKYNSAHPLQLHKIFLLQGVAICDINTEVGQQSLQELKEEYGQGRVIFIQVDVRIYQQLEGDRNLLWPAEKHQDKYIYDVYLKNFDIISYLPRKFLSAGIMSETLSIRLNAVSIRRRVNFEMIRVYG
jgi:hypothetical protein